tara:strand:- start:19823 stop:20986 length:1164 start_codon:yes stop_codon:yes gene_type:complete
MSNEEIHNALQKALAFAEQEKFKGYDPYDTLNTTLPIHYLGKWGKVLAIQFQKRFPWNIRPLLGIKKDYNPKAIGLLLQAYSNLYLLTNDEKYLNKAHTLFNWLKNNYTKGYSGYCWGYNFEWASPVKTLQKHSPTIVVTGFIAQGIYKYYQLTKDHTALDILFSINNFIENDLPKTEDNTGVCISYSTISRDVCYNASMLAAEHYARMFALTKKEEFKDKAIAIARFTVNKQHQNGKWNYSLNLSDLREREQIDFHQGYVLDSLKEVIVHCQANEFMNAYTKGLEFYAKNQFLPNGQAIYRLPKKYPVEIHNQSQGIITFSRAATLQLDYSTIARKIATYTINNMFNPNKGFFYYKKYPTHTIKTPFMRWNQAWMILALTEYELAQ